jgi:YfiH family protein
MTIDIPYLTSPLLDRLPWLAHGFGTAAWPQAEFERWAAARGWTPVVMNQVHTDAVHVLTYVPAEKLSGDALVTAVPGLCLVIRTADCLPVLLADPERRLVAAVHCGWRGTRARILAKAVDVMTGLGGDPGRLLVAFGPAIGAACYEVGPEVREAFAAAGFSPAIFRGVPGRPGRVFLDLRAANAGLLAERGVPAGNIAPEGPCTHCEPGLLSHRRDPSGEARMVNFIAVRRAPAKLLFPFLSFIL